MRIFLAVEPKYDDTNASHRAVKRGNLNSDAICLAARVLPQPGGPKSIIEDAAFNPYFFSSSLRITDVINSLIFSLIELFKIGGATLISGSVLSAR